VILSFLKRERIETVILHTLMTVFLYSMNVSNLSDCSPFLEVQPDRFLALMELKRPQTVENDHETFMQTVKVVTMNGQKRMGKIESGLSNASERIVETYSQGTFTFTLQKGKIYCKILHI
jgi:hypothetical protein